VTTPDWHDPTRSVADRVSALLAQMTLEEKVAQLGSRWVNNDLDHREEAEVSDANLNVAPMQDVFAASGTVPLHEASRHGLGHLTRVYGGSPLTVAEGAAEVVRQQHIVLDAGRLGIPALVHEECLTGFTTYGATVYPAAIAWGATFDPDLIERMAAAIGRDMAAVGVHQGLAVGDGVGQLDVDAGGQRERPGVAGVGRDAVHRGQERHGPVVRHDGVGEAPAVAQDLGEQPGIGAGRHTVHIGV
jgi:beta-glucosidase